MAVEKKPYADIIGDAFVDYTFYSVVSPNVLYFSGITFFPPTAGVFGVNCAEKFNGQTITVDDSTAYLYDRINGSPTNPLTLSPGATAQQNICLSWSGGSLGLSGCGTAATEIERIGEGTLAIKFEQAVNEIGLELDGIDDLFFYNIDPEYIPFTIVKIYCYSDSGELLGILQWGDDGGDPSGFVEPDERPGNSNILQIGITSISNIGGILIEAYDVNGVGVRKIKYQAECDGISLECSYNDEIFDYDSPSFPLIEDAETSTSIGFSNQVLKNNNLSEQRIIEHEYPIRNYSISKAILKTSELTLLRNFFHDRKGSLEEFLYNDRSDNSATKDDLILATGAKTWGQLILNPDVPEQYQLVKAYQVGESVHYRPITNPFNLTIYDGLSVVSATHEGGLFNGLPVPSSGSYRANFTFKVPVRMESDILEDKLLTKTVGGTKVMALDGLNLVEVKKNLRFYPASIYAENIDHEIAIDLRWGQVSETKYTTEIFSKGSGQESRKQRQRLPEYFVNLQPKGVVLARQMSYLISLWLCTKGQGYCFSIQDPVSDTVYPCRFDNSSFTYNNKSVNLIFETSAIKLKLFKDGEITDGGAYYIKVGNNWEKTISPFDNSVLHFANCLMITTSAGCKYTFTSHDKDIKIGENIYKASTAISPSVYSSNPSLAVNSEEFKTIFLQFDEDRLYSGLFKNAIVETTVVDWQNPPITLADGIDYQKGVVGKISSNGHYYSFEFLSLGASKLNQTYNPKTTSTCRHVFGDSNCKYEKIELCVSVSFTRTPTPTAIPVSIPDSLQFVIGNYRYGYVTLSGGTRHTINFLEIFEDNLWINLFNPLLQWPEPGSILLITEGCLRTLNACQYYNNSINFGAIPTTGNWVPGSYEYISPSISR